MGVFKETCVKLRKSGHTLNEIVTITKRPKTSVYHHISGISLSKSRELEIKIKKAERAREIARKRKGRSLKLFVQFDSWNSRRVLLLSHFLFDGSITKTSCIYNNRNLALVKRVSDLMRDLYPYEPKKYLNEKTRVSRVSYHNVALASYLKKKTQTLLRELAEMPKDLKRQFLKAFFDDEGCMDFRPKRNLRQIRGYQKNTGILNVVKKLLSDFGIESRVVAPNEIVIARKKNLKKFKDEINFSPSVFINGKRTNSLWKKPIEKRILLEKTLESFKI